MTMVDETKGADGTTGVGGFNPLSSPIPEKDDQLIPKTTAPQPSSAAVSYPEPQILSESIVEPAKVAPAVLPPPAPTPLPSFTSMPKSPQDLPPPVATNPTSKPSESTPLPAFSAMPKPGQQNPTVTSQPAFRHVEPAQTSGLVDPVLAKNQKKMSSDISRILKDVKLPERPEVKGAADKKMAVPNLSDAALQPSVAPKELKETPPGVVTDTSPVVAMHTLKDDIKNVVLEKKISIIRAASLEQDRERGDSTMEEIQRPKGGSFGIVFASGLFVFLGLAAIAGVYVVEMGRNGTTQTYGDSMVFSEQSLLLQIEGMSPQGLKSQIASARQTGGAALGSITRLIPVKTVALPDATSQTRLATGAEFLRALGTHAPDELVRAIGDNFFFGIHTVDKNSPVLVIPVNSYDHAFAGMLQWEANINSDLAPVFTKAQDTVMAPDGTPTKRGFQDAIMRNYDVRALKDDSGTIIMYYSFPTPKILLIAESPYSFNELLSRLQAQRQL